MACTCDAEGERCSECIENMMWEQRDRLDEAMRESAGEECD